MDAKGSLNAAKRIGIGLIGLMLISASSGTGLSRAHARDCTTPVTHSRAHRHAAGAQNASWLVASLSTGVGWLLRPPARNSVIGWHVSRLGPSAVRHGRATRQSAHECLPHATQ